MTSTLFRDVIFNVLLCFVVLALIMLPHINPDGEDAESEVTASMTFEAFWDDESDADVDMWLLGPDQVRVGYSNKNGRVLDLLRDDIGLEHDPSGRNHEIAFARAVISGEYICNLHMFEPDGATLPIDVKVVITIYDNEGNRMWRRDYDVTLRHRGDEVTVVRLTLEGPIVTQISRLPKAIRTESARWSSGSR